MSHAELAPPFGLTGLRRALAIALAAAVLTTGFVVAGFPYDLLAPRISAALESATGARVSIGKLHLGMWWLLPELRVGKLDLAWPGGPHLVLDRMRVRPAWSAAWLRGAPALLLALRGPAGRVDGTAVLGRAPAFRGELSGIDLALVPVEDLASGIDVDGRADARLDLRLADGAPQGTVHFEVKKGSLSVPMLPIGLPFELLAGDFALGGDALFQLDKLQLDGPLVALTASGKVGRGATAELSPLALHGRIEAHEPAIRTLLQSQGVALDGQGGASLDVGGTLGSPDLRPARGRGRAG